MSYADRLRQGITKGASAPQQTNTLPPPVDNSNNEIPDEDDSPLPTPVQPPVKSKPTKVVQQTPTPAPQTNSAPSHIPTYSGNYGAVWQKLKGHKEVTDHLARILGPRSVCSLGITCKDLFQKFFAPPLWSSVLQSQLPVTSKLQIKITLNVPVDSEIGKELADDAKENEEIEKEGKTLRVPVSYYKRETRCSKLVQYWMSIMDKEKPTLGGGLSIIKQKGKVQEKLLLAKDFNSAISWLDATVKLLEGKNSMELPYGKEKITLSRTGRGSTILVIKVGGASHYFEFKDFCLEICSRAKELKNLIGRSHVALKRVSKDIEEEHANKHIEQEEKLKNILKFSQYTEAVKSIKEHLKIGAIPRSDLPELFAAKRSSKQKYRQQLMMEYENVLEFVLSNLPPDFEEAKANANRQNQEVIERRLESERDKQQKREDKARLFAEKREKNNQALAAKMAAQYEEEEAESTKKKLKKVKETDAAGWVTEKKKRFDPITNEPEPEPEVAVVKKKKEEKKLPVKQAPAAKTAKRSNLAVNAFAPALQEESYETRAEAQIKKQEQKLKAKELAQEKRVAEQQKLQESNPELAKTREPQKPPKKQTQTKNQNTTKQKTVQKPKVKNQDTKKKQNITGKGGKNNSLKNQTSAGALEAKLIQPVAIVVGALVVVVLSYMFVFS